MNKPQASRCRRGFTLIELIMVVLLLGIMAVFSIPQMKGLYEQSEMARVATGVIELLQYAQQRAVLEQQPQTIVIDVPENDYWMEVLDEARERKRRGARANSYRRRQKTLETLEGRLPVNFEFDYCYLPLQDDVVRRDEARLMFYPDGSCDGLNLTIAKTNPNDRYDIRYLFLKVNPNTGRVSFRESRNDRDADDFFSGYWDEEEGASE